ncbi:MAG: hypothetical protein AMXMBFR33_68110 [Candidatus Xenobia bacterium]
MERDELILRINGVEKSQRLCKAMVLVLIIVLSLILLQGAGPKHTQLKAHSLNIINEEGDVVATIGTDKEGGVFSRSWKANNRPIRFPYHLAA